MSILLHHPRTAPARFASLRWAAADEDSWSADDAGAFAGTIDRHGAHFFVRNGFGEYLGDYRTFGAAQAALAEHVGRARSVSSC